MKITIQQLKLNHFKGIRNATIVFNESANVIAGRNATGKSTIADAFSWLLFGKDMLDRKDFEVKTLQNGEVIPRIDHEVEAIIYIDGVKETLKRTLKEKWVKKQGTNEQVFTGNETIYTVNDVPKSQKDYQDYINKIIPEATFKLLTNPAYFNSIKWQDRRAMLTAIASIQDDDSIAGKELADVLIKMRSERKSFEDFKKEYAAKRQKIKAAMESIPSRIDELNRTKPEQKNWAEIQAKIDALRSEVSNLQKRISNANDGNKEAFEYQKKAIDRKMFLQSKIAEKDLAARKQFLDDSGKKDREIADLNNQFEQIKNLLKRKNDLLGIKLDDAGQKEKQLVTLRAEYRIVSDLIYNDHAVCPTCGQPMPKDKALESFNKEKADRLIEINRRGVLLKSQKEEIEADISSLDNDIKAHTLSLRELENKNKEIKNSPSNLKPVELILSEDVEYVSIKKELDAIEIPEVATVDTTNISDAIKQMNNEIEALIVELSNREIIERANAREKELLDEEKALADELTIVEGMEYSLQQFQSKKMQAVEDAVNKLFPTVKFRMFDQQINGGIADTCETMINGVPFSDANRAAQINAGLEIIATFSKVHDTYCPIFIDNAEAVNSLFDIPTQIVALYVNDSKDLEVNKISKVA